MIRINLATKKTSVTSGSNEARLGTGLVKFDVRLDELKELPLRKIGLVVVASLLLSHLIESDQQERLSKLGAEIAKVDAQKKALQVELTKIQGYDTIKKALEADEEMIRRKIQTVSELIADRSTPPKILIALSEGIPENVWLSEFTINDTEIKLDGFSLGFNHISDFMSNISQSAYFENVKLVESRQEKAASVTSDAVAKFTLQAERKKVSE